MAELSGGLVNYYLSWVAHPQRPNQAPYMAECEDIVESLELNPDEANIFKEIWRTANARKGNGKPGNTPVRAAEKYVHYGQRLLRRARRNEDDSKATAASSPINRNATPAASGSAGTTISAEALDDINQKLTTAFNDCGFGY